MWMEYPGGNLRFASYNKTDQISDYSKGYVLPLTYFGNVLNISAIEFLPVGAGSIAIELVRPICDGSFKWCTLTKACEKNCVSDFESKTSRYDALGEFFYDPYSCKGDKDFCSAEETCSNELKCPTSITKAIDKW